MDSDLEHFHSTYGTVKMLCISLWVGTEEDRPVQQAGEQEVSRRHFNRRRMKALPAHADRDDENPNG
jgi:hypothetical protein